MAIVGINLNEVVEKPRIPADQIFTFSILKASLELSKNPNKKTGNREPVIKCELCVDDPDYVEKVVYHNWSLSPAALSSDDPRFSIKKFFTLVGFKWDSDGFDTQDMLSIKFQGKVSYPDNKFAQLDTIISGV